MRVSDILREHGLAPKKSFGQNFLVDADALAAIAHAALDGLASPINVIELGAGTGALTAALLARDAVVTAVERDRDLVPILQRQFEANDKFRLVEGDAKTVVLGTLFDSASPVHPETKQARGARVLTGNLPYQLTGPLCALATEQSAELDRVVFLIQREVAERLCAAPRSKEYGALSVFVQNTFTVERVRDVGPGCFLPPPKVTSTVVRLTPRREPLHPETSLYRSLVKQAFGQRRKQLRNAWNGIAQNDAEREILEPHGQKRGEELAPTDYAAVAQQLAALRSGSDVKNG
jgi:16S rRNA (adenine1518-N6/adenine1519-N6)-dimethyltransferase